jgi:hypothetical protein
MEPNARLAFSVRLRGLSAPQREEFLQQCLSRTEPERTSLLSLLLLDWAATEPAAACEWALSHLEGAAKSQCVQDLVRTWANRDGLALAEWYNAFVVREGRAKLNGRPIDIDISSTLAQYDPVAYGRFAEMECNRDSVVWGMNFERSLRSLDTVKDIGMRLSGQVEYIQDLTKLRKDLAIDSSGRCAPNKWGWNELFERTSVAWHRMDAEGCEAWLNTWPENAQMAARYSIAKAEAEARPAAVAPAPVTEPAQRPSAQAPGTGAWDQARADWSAWWRTDAAAAEAFLNASEWPEDLKFRARAKAYSSPP